MSSSASGIFNYDKMEDKDKSYLLKLSVTIIAAILIGIITGTMYSNNINDPWAFTEDPTGTSIWVIGWLTFLGVQGAMAYYIKIKFDLSEMSNQQLFRHGIFVGLLMYIFFWAVIFNFILFS